MPVAVMEEGNMAAAAHLRASLLVLLYALPQTARSMAHTHMMEIGIATRVVSTGIIMLYVRWKDVQSSGCMSIMGHGIIAPTIRMAAAAVFAEGALVTGSQPLCRMREIVRGIPREHIPL